MSEPERRRPPPPRGPPPASQEEAGERMLAVTGQNPDFWFAEIESITEDLNDARLALAAHKAHMARLESEFGSIGNLPSIWDHERRQLLSELAEGERERQEARWVAWYRLSKEERVDQLPPQKITESGLDTYAHANDLYEAFLLKAKGERKEYEEQRAKFDELWAVVHHLSGKREYLVQRIRMVEESIRFHGKLANT